MSLPTVFEERLRRYAEVIVRVGLNLQPDQRLLIAEPFELQGVPRGSAALVEAVGAAATAAGAREIGVIWGDEARLRAAAQDRDDAEFEQQLADNRDRMLEHVRRGDALLFLQASHPELLQEHSGAEIAHLRERCWRYYGSVAQQLVTGATNWTVAPAPTPEWAGYVFSRPDSAGSGNSDSQTYAGASRAEASPALAQLFDVVFAACFIDEPDPLVTWREHLARLAAVRDELDARGLTHVVYRGPGSNLEVLLAREHVWCTADLTSRAGHRFVANLPTHEVFTAPDHRSVDGIVRVARPVAYGGAVIDGIELEFRDGRVVKARARVGEELLRRALATDRGASRLGEVAIVPYKQNALASSRRCFAHALLDENALDHIALGAGYPFAVKQSGAAALNGSLIHLDLPIETSEPVVPRGG